jgi:hypothetical protein
MLKKTFTPEHIYLFFFFFFGGTGFELRASQLQSRCSTTRAIPPGHFALVILDWGFHELFAQPGVDLSLPSS